MLPIRVQSHTKVAKVPWLPAQVVYAEWKIGTDRQTDRKTETEIKRDRHWQQDVETARERVLLSSSKFP